MNTARRGRPLTQCPRCSAPVGARNITESTEPITDQWGIAVRLVFDSCTECKPEPEPEPEPKHGLTTLPLYG